MLLEQGIPLLGKDLDLFIIINNIRNLLKATKLNNSSETIINIKLKETKDESVVKEEEKQPEHPSVVI